MQDHAWACSVCLEDVEDVLFVRSVFLVISLSFFRASSRGGSNLWITDPQLLAEFGPGCLLIACVALDLGCCTDVALDSQCMPSTPQRPIRFL